MPKTLDGCSSTTIIPAHRIVPTIARMDVRLPHRVILYFEPHCFLRWNKFVDYDKVIILNS